MLEKNVMIGMKVVAHSKTVPKFTRNYGFPVELIVHSKVNKSGYPELKHANKEVFNLSGNFYYASDFEPIELTKPKWRIDNPCAEVVLNNV